MKPKRMSGALVALSLGILLGAGSAVAQPPAGMQAKVEKVRNAADARAKSGLPPIRIMIIMNEFEPLLREGKTAEAEAVLDRALAAAESKTEDQLERKLRRVQEGVRKLEKKREDLTPIPVVMAPLESLLKAADVPGIEAVLDRALELIDARDRLKEPEALAMKRIQEKMKDVQELAPAWARSGGDVQEVAPLAGTVDSLLKVGKLLEAEKAVDDALAKVRSKPAAGAK